MSEMCFYYFFWHDFPVLLAKTNSLLRPTLPANENCFSLFLGVDNMQHRSNRIIRFCGWWLEFFSTKLYMWAISYCHFWDCISVFFVHFSTNSFIPGAPPFFQSIFCCSIQRFYTNSHKSLILFYGSFLNFGTNSYKLIRTIVIQIV